MCGISGFIDLDRRSRSMGELRGIAAEMSDALVHRGPDDAGIWIDQEAAVALGFRRLAILDLSGAGHQPMVSAAGRHVIVFNGEIYNHEELRDELGSEAVFHGSSDTETLLAAIERWGIPLALKKSVGMFAVAVWDRATRQLTLARDRIGEKPLYYGTANGSFYFASELKALRRHPNWDGEVDSRSLALFMRYRYIPAPYSIYKGFFKLVPGTYLTVDPNRLRKDRSLPEPRYYWNPAEAIQSGLDNPLTCGPAEAIDRLQSVLQTSVSAQMISDVPLGAFLSGGIDSTSVVALMQSVSTRPVNTFSIGFHDQRLNEAGHAKQVARHLGTHHTELYVSDEDARQVILHLPTLYDEPMADFSSIPMHLVSKLARQHVTVSLSGDGGDELFCGYRRHVQGAKLWRLLRSLPRPMRALFAKSIVNTPPSFRNVACQWLEPMLRRQGGARSVSDQLETLAYTLGARDPDDLYRCLVSDWRDPSTILPDAEEYPSIAPGRMMLDQLDAQQNMMYRDLLTYLPGAILTKVDRASMGTSLESRAPFLDHRVVEFAWRIPLDLKYRDGKGKWILRQLLYQHVPRHLVERPKKGFTPPLADWLRGPLRDWAEAFLDEQTLVGNGLKPEPIRRKWSQHLSNTHNWVTPLWNVLTFLAWQQTQRSRAAKLAA